MWRASSTSATHGPAVNTLCSSPYATCVGGTEFTADLATPSAYWSATNTPGTNASALQYIGEAVWNQSGSVSGGSDLWSSGGGVSIYYAKPAWQLSTGVPSDGFRDVPSGGVQVTIEGALASTGDFQASLVMAKCSSKYDPAKHEMKDGPANAALPVN